MLIPTSQIESAFLEEIEKTKVLTEQPDQTEEEATPEPITSREVAIQLEASPAIVDQQKGQPHGASKKHLVDGSK